MEVKSAVCDFCKSKMEMNYRWAEEKDLPEILQLLGGLPKAGTGEHIRNFLVAVVNGNIIACMGLEIHRGAYGSIAVLRSLKVKRGFRRQHIATTLFTKILNTLKSKGVTTALGFTLTKKVEAMVKKFGAARVSKKEAYSYLNKSLPSEIFDDRLSRKCKAWFFKIIK